jgi:hypothetical protein
VPTGGEPANWYNVGVSSLHSLGRSLAVVASALGVTFVLLFGVVFGPSVNAQTTPVGGSAVTRCGVLTVDNPSPGDRLIEGGYVVSGLAYDPASTDGPGVSRVDFFLGSRDEGGVFLGSAIPGQLADPRAYRTTLDVPKVVRVTSGTTFVAYAYDSASVGETIVSVPVQVGPVPTSTPTTAGQTSEPQIATTTSNCQATELTPRPQAAVATPTPMAAAAAAAAAPAPTNAGIVFEIANPSPGDLLQVGRYQISGVAYDPASTSGSGIDRIEFFLDPRDDGGILLGEAVPDGSGRTFSGEFAVPAGVRQKGLHTFTAYARSSVSGREAVVSIPLYFGALPTATPHP